MVQKKYFFVLFLQDFLFIWGRFKIKVKKNVYCLNIEYRVGFKPGSNVFTWCSLFFFQVLVSWVILFLPRSQKMLFFLWVYQNLKSSWIVLPVVILHPIIGKVLALGTTLFFFFVLDVKCTYNKVLRLAWFEGCSSVCDFFT